MIPVVSRGLFMGGLLIVSRKSRERKTGLHLHPLNIIKKWKVNWRRIIFKPQVPDNYQTEALRVLRVHGLEYNSINNKHNWVQIIPLCIWKKCVPYYLHNTWNNMATLTVTPCYANLTLNHCFPGNIGYSSLYKGRYHGAFISFGISYP